MSAFPRLSALCHFDLYLAGTGKILCGHAESSACDLLDQRIPDRAEPCRIFSALPGIRTGMKTVHRFGKRFMRFPGQRSVGHCPGVETGHDPVCTLHFLKRNRFRLFYKGTGIPQMMRFHFPKQLYIVLIVFKRTASRCFLKRQNHFRRIQMFTGGRVAAKAMASGTVQGGIHLQSERIKGVRMTVENILFNILKGDRSPV